MQDLGMNGQWYVKIKVVHILTKGSLIKNNFDN